MDFPNSPGTAQNLPEEDEPTQQPVEWRCFTVHSNRLDLSPVDNGRHWKKKASLVEQQCLESRQQQQQPLLILKSQAVSREPRLQFREEVI
ncbi:hypothetical protein TYRP_010943 [Tyrophagus putrescentiae]|nr:hypothetical protein TYRP_010943 [Tyrophagus putrescentiae]